QDLSRSSCSDVSTLSDPGAFTNEGNELPPGVRAIGFGDSAFYKAPADTFAALDANDPRRIQGAVAQVLIVAIGAELPDIPTPDQRDALFEKVKNKEIPSVIVLDRIRVTEDPQRNHNPSLSSIEENGVTVPEGGKLRFFPDRDTPLKLFSPDADFEQYDQLTPEGADHKTERIIAALYSTTGRFEQPRLEVGSDTPENFQAPTGASNNPKPEDRRGTFWAVLRDTRGGQSAYELPFVLCDRSLPAPELFSLSPSEGLGDGTQRVTLTGRNLSSVMDVGVGGKALSQLTYDPARDVLEGFVPVLDPGEHPLLVRGEHCADVSTTFTFKSH
ncbi:MAG: hypothetical protein ACJ790_13490, partial [Myxococcaceae bacterium]